ncbi:hypothetical protein CPB84DRAFT_1393705 [Gymnopilus junonius]|uniref:Uncharacterized protein n=1 Tax=Gymnopilus junonius TaxID=109634 RepID=A0A9P5N718_GYMJU|nr:hypothetical protein CPB84DRAFT_1393705 [Gymnopilus junonius]
MGKRHPIWQYFIAGTKQNGSHLQAHCIGCVEAQQPEGLAIDLTNDDLEKLKLSSESWVMKVCSRLMPSTPMNTRSIVLVCPVLLYHQRYCYAQPGSMLQQDWAVR